MCGLDPCKDGTVIRGCIVENLDVSIYPCAVDVVEAGDMVAISKPAI
jgi:hypothetical protein